MPIAAFAEVRIDDNLIIYKTSGGPKFNTSVVIVNSGVESRNVIWSFPLGKWELGERDMMPTDFSIMKNFFNARYGKAQGFRAKIWEDYKDDGQGVLLPIVGSTTTLQMYKNYPSGPTSGQRKIVKPIASPAIKVFRDAGAGLGPVLDAGAAVNTTTGVVTPTLMTGTLTWTGQFDWPVRFDVDQMRFEFIAADGLGGGPAYVVNAYFHLFSLPIVELRL